LSTMKIRLVVGFCLFLFAGWYLLSASGCTTNINNSGDIILNSGSTTASTISSTTTLLPPGTTTTTTTIAAEPTTTTTTTSTTTTLPSPSTTSTTTTNAAGTTTTTTMTTTTLAGATTTSTTSSTTTTTTTTTLPGVTTTSAGATTTVAEIITTTTHAVVTTTTVATTTTSTTTPTTTLTTTTLAGGLNINPPAGSRVKLIFIHHSCGENWLEDTGAGFDWAGGLGAALEDNNYFVSDTYYDWGPDSIGSSTDTTDWPTWFDLGNETYFDAVCAESGQNSTYYNFERHASNPGGENQIIMFKSCYPNSEVEGSIDDEQAIYNSLLPFFSAHPEKLFVFITPPGKTHVLSYVNTRTLCNWLVASDGWLSGYTASDGSFNVAVFDFYCVLSETTSHHTIEGASIIHEYAGGYDGTSPYHDDETEDAKHPNGDGNTKATTEFIPLLNYFYHRWQDSK